MTPQYARWVLAAAHQKTQTIESVLRQLQKYMGRQARSKEQDLAEAKKRLEWAVERATKVLLDDQVRS